MSHVLTKPRRASVDAFLSAIEHEQRQEDCRAIAALMQAATYEKPVMWGPSIHRPTLRELVQRLVKRLKTIVAARTRTRAS